MKVENGEASMGMSPRGWAEESSRGAGVLDERV